jgi:hypothetical protein
VRSTLPLLTLALAVCDAAFPSEGRDASGTAGTAGAGRLTERDATAADADIDSTGVPVVAHVVDRELRVARRTGAGVWTTTRSAPLSNPVRAAFFTLGLADEPHVAVSTQTIVGSSGRLDVAQVGIPTASSWTFEPLVGQQVTGVVRRASGEVDVSVVSNTRDLHVHTRAPQGGWSVGTVQLDVTANGRASLDAAVSAIGAGHLVGDVSLGGYHFAG